MQIAYKAIAIGVALTSLSGCAQRPTSYNSSAPRYVEPSCNYVFDSNFSACAFRARSNRDGDIAYAISRHYKKPFDKTSTAAMQSFEWTKTAAEWGNSKAQRELHDAYYFGNGPVPENKELASLALSQAANSGAQWAVLMQAVGKWKSNPTEARAAIGELAQKNNCHAQSLLAATYRDGTLGEKNWTKSYFWLLLAQTGGRSRSSEIHFLTRIPGSTEFASASSESCYSSRAFMLKLDLDRALPTEFVRMASNAATAWRANTPEPELTAPPATIMVEKKATPVAPQAASKPPAPRAATPAPKEEPKSSSRTPELVVALPTLPKWRPVQFEKTATNTGPPLPLVELFETTNKFVWIVRASSQRPNERSQGSAVAINGNQLITNCHVIERATSISIMQGKDTRVAKLASASADSDRCVITVDKPLSAYSSAVRPFESLKVGEEVISIGSPKGLENTLGTGVISGLRRLDGMQIVQTTAPISPGSSGGGLFDLSGNLIGITTFYVKDSGSLNFAIAAENFVKAD